MAFTVTLSNNSRRITLTVNEVIILVVVSVEGSIGTMEEEALILLYLNIYFYFKIHTKMAF